MTNKTIRKPLCDRHRDRETAPVLCHTCQRIGVEHDIVERTIKALFAVHYVVFVENGDDEPIGPFRYHAEDGLQPSVNRVLAAMFETDDEVLRVEPAPSLQHRGWVHFVYGNDGYDVISDYSTNLESVLKPVTDYADTLAI